MAKIVQCVNWKVKDSIYISLSEEKEYIRLRRRHSKKMKLKIENIIIIKNNFGCSRPRYMS
eukprot:snap_masked-scaffold_7-processed-gene-17.22-mRNA-1 protein AED:1.00 eAED:1.00 QI:0/0/0/0/1/1/2/0/60